jgi:hypothetical protein
MLTCAQKIRDYALVTMKLHFTYAVASLLLMLYRADALAAADSCQPIVTFADGKRPAREIFVSPAGDNSSGNGSRTTPYQSIARALQGIRPGDAVRLLPGNYSGGSSISNISGVAEAPIWIGGESRQTKPVISGGSIGLHLSRVRYLVVENLEIRGVTGNGINCDDGAAYANTNATRHILFQNLSIRDIGTGKNQDGLKLSGLNDFFVLDCEFAGVSANGSGIDHVGCHRGLVARCTFNGGGNSVQCKGGSENIEIRWNRFNNPNGRAVNIGGSTGFTFFRPPLLTNGPNAEARNIRVVANLFRGGDAPITFAGAVDSIAAHNTIIDPNRWIVRILQESISKDGREFLPCGKNQFVNNLIYFDSSRITIPISIGPHTDAASFYFANNLWHAHDRPNRSRPTFPSMETDGLYGMDPKFRNVSESDFSLAPNSPAAGKGKRLPNLPADLAERCYADPPAIGAFEAR